MKEKPRLPLQELSDRAEIGDIVARLGYTQDDKDFDGLGALFADRIGFDMSAAGGDPATELTRYELADLARTVLSGFTATQHRACNLLTTVDGDIAHCRVMVEAWHTVPTDPGIADFYAARNNWLLRLKRIDGRWLITRWAIVKAAPSDGYQGVYQVAQARAAQELRGLDLRHDLFLQPLEVVERLGDRHVRERRPDQQQVQPGLLQPLEVVGDLRSGSHQ